MSKRNASHLKLHEETAGGISCALPDRPLADQRQTRRERGTDHLPLAAGRIQRESKGTKAGAASTVAERFKEQLASIVRWQQSRQPTVKPLLDGWEVAGWTESPSGVSHQFHDWFVQPSGLLATAVGKSAGDSLAGAMNIAAVHAAMKAHSGYVRGAGRLLNRINETIWTSGSGDQFASLFFALVHPERGSLQWSAAGDVHAILMRGSAYKSLGATAPLLGADPDAKFRCRHTGMQRGDILLMYAGNHRGLPRPNRTLAASMARQVLRCQRLECNSLAAALRQPWRADAGTGNEERSLVIVHRQ